jgi:hypothetical protein
MTDAVRELESQGGCVVASVLAVGAKFFGVCNLPKYL